MESFILALVLYVWIWFICAVGVNPNKVAWISFILFTVAWIPTFYNPTTSIHFMGYFTIPIFVLMIIVNKLKDEKKIR